MNEGRGDFIRQVRSQRGRRTIDLKERNSALVLPRMDAPYMHTFSFCSGSRAVIKRKKCEARDLDIACENHHNKVLPVRGSFRRIWVSICDAGTFEGQF